MKADTEDSRVNASNGACGAGAHAAHDVRKHGGRPRALVLLLCLVLLAVVGYAAWRWTPLSEWVDIRALYGWLRSFRDQPLAPYILLGIYVAASQIMFPITVLIIATAYAFGPWLGFAYAMAGSVLGAVVSYGIGYSLGPETFKRLTGRYCEVVHRALNEQGLTAAIMTHMLPVAPFTVVNLGSGVVRIRFRDFLIGTVLGLVPGTAVITIFVHRIDEMMRNPGVPSLILLLASGAVLYISWRWGRRRMER
jgi:uncharacterized membrane protein YdjX (TVP38/TMEM64 family)